MGQSAASREHYGLYLGAICTRKTPTIHEDCASVVRSATSHEYAVDWRRPFAGLWKMIPQETWPNVIKTKAHRTMEEAKESNDLQHWAGNYQEDLYAKKAAEAGLAPQILLDAQDTVLNFWPQLILAISALFAVWPFPKEAYASGRWLPGGKKQKKLLRPWVSHNWAYSPTLHRYVCTGCKAVTTEKRADRCKGGIARVFHGSHATYTLAHEITGETLWFCDTCGLYTQVKMCGMANQCMGPRQYGSPAWYALKKLRNGQHPGLRRKVNPVSPAHWGTPIKGVHKVIGNLPAHPRMGTLPVAQGDGLGTLPPSSTSARRSDARDPDEVDPEPDPFGPNGVYRFEVPEEDLGLDQGSFFGMDDQFLI